MGPVYDYISHCYTAEFHSGPHQILRWCGRALVHALVDIFHGVKTLARLDVGVGFVLPAQIRIVRYDPFIPYWHRIVSIRGLDVIHGPSAQHGMLPFCSTV
jgi:hypothetical protein